MLNTIASRRTMIVTYITITMSIGIVRDIILFILITVYVANGISVMMHRIDSSTKTSTVAAKHNDLLYSENWRQRSMAALLARTP